MSNSLFQIYWSIALLFAVCLASACYNNYLFNKKQKEVKNDISLAA